MKSTSTMPDPHYGDCSGRGETLATHEEEHLCPRCIHSEVCHAHCAVAMMTDELLIAITRCRAFVTLEQQGP